MERGALADRLREEGYRATLPRLRVYEVLHEAGRHLTADEIADALGRDDEPATLSSVYRALAVLDDLDVIRSTRLDDGDASHWELAHPDEHFHVICRSCGTVDHHRGTLVRLIEDHLREGHDFDPDEVAVIVRGTCGACRRQVTG